MLRLAALILGTEDRLGICGLVEGGNMSNSW